MSNLTHPESLWSTSSVFSFTNLAIVMTIISLFTYLTVFNLERFVRNSHSVYAMYRRNIVERMNADLGWEDRAKRFDAFEPDRRSNKPTDWYVLWASVLLFSRHCRRVILPGCLRMPRRVLHAFWDTGKRNGPGRDR